MDWATGPPDGVWSVLPDGAVKAPIVVFSNYSPILVVVTLFPRGNEDLFPPNRLSTTLPKRPENLDL